MYNCGIKTCVIVFVPQPFFSKLYLLLYQVKILKITINILDPNYTNMVRNGGNTVSDMLASTKEGLQKWTDDNLDGCRSSGRSSHFARAVSNSLPVVFRSLKIL